MIHKLVKVRGADFCDDQFPIISTIGRGPKGKDAPIPMKFADPIEWDINSEYDSFTVVMHDGNSYTSKQSVPIGVDISDDEYWVLSGPYNAQVERYRMEVEAFDARISQNTNDINVLLPKTAFNDSNTVKSNIDTINATLSTYQTKMLVIGDSYSSHELSGDQQNDSSLWWYLVANKLNLTPTVFAKSGAGYVHASDGITFDTLATNAINSITDKDKYRYVFIYGGLNDLRLDVPTATFQTTVQTLLPKIANAFPKSTVIVMGCNTFVNQNINANNATQTTFSHVLSTICVAAGCTFINTNTWLLGWTSQFNGADHPNQFGETRIGSLVLMHMFGSSSNAGIQEGSFTNNANWSTENVSSIQINNSILTNESMFWNLTLVTDTIPTNETRPIVHLPWNMSTGITNATTQTIVPIIMRNGSNFYHDFYGQLNKNTLTIFSQNWPSVSGQCFFYLDFISPMNY